MRGLAVIVFVWSAVCCQASVTIPINTPNVWGAAADAGSGVLSGCSGQLFVYSGIDGVSNQTASFIGVVDSSPYSIKLCLPTQRMLSLTLSSSPSSDEGATAGDVVEASTSDVLLVHNESNVSTM
jgi:hypothetical protein